MKLIAVAMLLFLVGCKDPNYVESTNRKTSGTFVMQTVEYDGHKFIWAEGTYSGNLLHHPDCPCQK